MNEIQGLSFGKKGKTAKKRHNGSIDKHYANKAARRNYDAELSTIKNSGNNRVIATPSHFIEKPLTSKKHRK